MKVAQGNGRACWNAWIVAHKTLCAAILARAPAFCFHLHLNRFAERIVLRAICASIRTRLDITDSECVISGITDFVRYYCDVFGRPIRRKTAIYRRPSLFLSFYSCFHRTLWFVILVGWCTD